MTSAETMFKLGVSYAPASAEVGGRRSFLAMKLTGPWPCVEDTTQYGIWVDGNATEAQIESMISKCAIAIFKPIVMSERAKG